MFSAPILTAFEVGENALQNVGDELMYQVNMPNVTSIVFDTGSVTHVGNQFMPYIYGGLNNLQTIDFKPGTLQNLGYEFLWYAQLPALTDITFETGSLVNVWSEFMTHTTAPSLTTINFDSGSLQTLGYGFFQYADDLSSLSNLNF